MHAKRTAPAWLPRAFVQSFHGVSPLHAFERLSVLPGFAWLDSSLPRADDGRFSIMAACPRWTLTGLGDRWELQREGRRTSGDGGALGQLDTLLGPPVAADSVARSLPFLGGAMGWLSYDLGRRFESLPAVAADDLAVPDLHLNGYDAALVWDHVRGDVHGVALAGERSAESIFADLRSWLQGPPAFDATHVPPPRPITARSNLTEAEYVDRVRQVRDGIARGDYYQLNLVQRLSCPHTEPPALTYLRLRAQNPAPFSAYLDTAPFTVLSSSPERFIQLSPDGIIRTCPIKGTRPRGTTAVEDAQQRAELLASPKERAELLMIVDLLRNDLGRVCEPGSVTVSRLHSIETFATVHHLVGDVHGRLRTGLSYADVLRAVFPGGSITGAPKVSAMRAIEQLEPHRRGIAMGAMGYFSAHRQADLNIAIRTIVSTRQQAYVGVGAGIVWDSDPVAEYRETLTKARALCTALGVESLAS